MNPFSAAAQPASVTVPAAESSASGFCRIQEVQNVLDSDVLLSTLALSKSSAAHVEQRAVEVMDGLWELDHARQLEVLQTRLQRQQDDAEQLRQENTQLRDCCRKVNSAPAWIVARNLKINNGTSWSASSTGARQRITICRWIRSLHYVLSLSGC